MNELKTDKQMPVRSLSSYSSPLGKGYYRKIDISLIALTYFVEYVPPLRKVVHIL